MQKLSRSALALAIVAGLLIVAPQAAAADGDSRPPDFKFIRSDPAGVFTTGAETSAVVVRDSLTVWGFVEDADPDDAATMNVFFRVTDEGAWERLDVLEREIVADKRGVKSAKISFEAKIDLSSAKAANGKIHFLATEAEPSSPGADSDMDAIRFVKLGSNARETKSAVVQSAGVAAHFEALRARLAAVADNPRVAGTPAAAHIHDAIAALARADAELAKVDVATPLIAATDLVLDAREARISAEMDLLAAKEARVAEARKARDDLLASREAHANDARALVEDAKGRVDSARFAAGECKASVTDDALHAECLRQPAKQVRARLWRR